MWSFAIAATASLSLLAGVLAVAYQLSVSRPVGEGELFVAESSLAAARLADAAGSGRDLDLAVRSVRNDLEVEAVRLVDESGIVIASTSPNLLGEGIDGFLAARLSDRLFGAIAHPISRDIYLDGVREWSAGDVLYEVVAPVADRGVIVSYDISALFGRRARERAIRPLTWIAGGAAVVLAIGAALLVAGRQGARRRTMAADLERSFLQERSRELELHNRELDEARRRAERALALAEETNRVRSEFVLMINHELRTPLTGVVTGSELLLESGVGLTAAERDRLLTDVVDDAHHLQRLIGQMLIVARIENRSLDYDIRPVGLDELRRRLEESGTRAEVWRNGDVPADLLTDVDSLTQLVMLLVDNAHTHGASRVVIRIGHELEFTPSLVIGEPDNAGVFLTVIDDGPGIDLAFLPRIFEKFEKRGRASGVGLGLYLARMLAEGIGSSISVASGPSGTAMAVGIPGVAQRARVVV